MLVNGENLRMLGTAFNTAYKDGLGMASPDHLKISTVVKSSTASNEYGWLGQFPSVRKWIGDRVIQGLSAHRYAIINDDYELTIGVKRNDIEDDNIGIYTPMFQDMGQSVQSSPCELMYGLLKAGFTNKCYDGQYYFDTDHPVLDVNGQMQSVANTDGGSGTPWFLIDNARPLKPLIFQDRKAFNFTSMDKPTDENVFMRKEFMYGSDARFAGGYGFWQIAWGSRQPLNDANYTIAKAALSSMKGDFGRPLGITGKMLVVPSTLERQARQLIKADRDASGASNVWVDSAEMFMSPWLA